MSELPLRVGRIAYRNVLPIYHPLESGRIPHTMRFVHGPPAELNRRMRAGELDLASVSSIEYAADPERYRLLPNLAIGSRGPVRSVLLLSRVPVEQLEGRSILVSAETHTSARLLALLLQEHWRVEARLETGAGAVNQALAQGARPQALLAIGDEALLLRHCADYPVRIDLGAVWHRWTGLPFVFGLWVMRRELVEERPQVARQACARFLAAKDWGLRNLESLLPLASQGLGAGAGLDVAALRDYFQGLCFDLGPLEKAGLVSFFHALQAAGLLEQAPPLHFCDLSPQDVHA